MKLESEKTVDNTHHLAQNNNQKDPSVIVITENGIILEPDETSNKLLDYSPRKLSGKHISTLIPLLGEIELLEKRKERVNPYLRFLSRIGYGFTIIDPIGSRFSSELYFSDVRFHNQHLIIIKLSPVKNNNRH